MKPVLFLSLLALPLAARAQQLAATAPPLTYHVGLTKAPLYRRASDTLGRPAAYLYSQQEASVVGKFAPGWVVVRREGFLYLTPTRILRDYDPDDTTPPPLDAQTRRITYEGVVSVAGATQADLYARAEAWVARTYTSTDEVQRPAPAVSQLTIKGARRVMLNTVYEGVARPTYAGVVQHVLTIYVKEGRYKYVLTDMAHAAAGTPRMQSGGPLEQPRANLYGYAGIGSQKPWDDLKVEATRDARHLLTDLQAAMTLQKPTKTAKSPSDF